MKCIGRSLVIAAAMLAAAACAQRMTEMDTGDIAMARWTATLSPPGVTDSSAAAAGPRIVGSVALAPGTTISETRATVMLANASPGAVYPWHIHAGSCGSDGGIVGPPASYTPISVGSDGKGESTVTLPFSTPTQGDFYVNIHKSPTELGTIVACGNLSMGTEH